MPQRRLPDDVDFDIAPQAVEGSEDLRLERAKPAHAQRCRYVDYWPLESADDPWRVLGRVDVATPLDRQTLSGCNEVPTSAGTISATRRGIRSLLQLQDLMPGADSTAFTHCCNCRT